MGFKRNACQSAVCTKNDLLEESSPCIENDLCPPFLRADLSDLRRSATSSSLVLEDLLEISLNIVFIFPSLR